MLVMMSSEFGQNIMYTVTYTVLVGDREALRDALLLSVMARVHIFIT